MDTDLDTLVTALYVKIDDRLVKDRRPGHPVRLSQAELVCLAVAQALLGFHSEHRWIRFAICHLRGCFPYLPHQPGCSKRLRAALPLVRQVIRDLAADSDFWFDNVWIADSTPVECGRSRPALSRACRPKLHKPTRCTLCARSAGAPCQDAFLILKLATYSSGFAGSNGFPITENDLYDAAGGVRPMSFMTLPVSVAR